MRPKHVCGQAMVRCRFRNRHLNVPPLIRVSRGPLGNAVATAILRHCTRPNYPEAWFRRPMLPEGTLFRFRVNSASRTFPDARSYVRDQCFMIPDKDDNPFNFNSHFHSAFVSSYGTTAVTDIQLIPYGGRGSLPLPFSTNSLTAPTNCQALPCMVGLQY